MRHTTPRLASWTPTHSPLPFPVCPLSLLFGFPNLSSKENCSTGDVKYEVGRSVTHVSWGHSIVGWLLIEIWDESDDLPLGYTNTAVPELISHWNEWLKKGSHKATAGRAKSDAITSANSTKTCPRARVIFISLCYFENTFWHISRTALNLAMKANTS